MPSTRRKSRLYSGGNYLRVQQATWSSTVSGNLLLEAGFGTYLNHWGGVEIPGNPTRDIVRVVELCSAGCAANGGIAGLTYRSQNWAINIQKAFNWKASATYVTGRHNLKVGYQASFNYTSGHPWTNSHNLQYRVNNGIPNQLTQNMAGFYTTENRVPTFGVVCPGAMDRRPGHLPGRAAIRPRQQLLPGAEARPEPVPDHDVLLPRTVGVTGYDDLTPRGGVAWDLFGDGKTAVKINGGRYLQNAVAFELYTATNPLTDIPLSVTRTWTDANNNFSPDCNLNNLNNQDLRSSGGDFCGVVSDLNFGTSNPSARYDPELLGGWGRRPGDWLFAASIQQEVLPRVSVEAGYTRRWLMNFSATDNLAVTPADFGTFSVVADNDPRLPNAGETISGLYNVNSNKVGAGEQLRHARGQLRWPDADVQRLPAQRLRASDASPPPAVRPQPGEHALRHLLGPGGLAGIGPAESPLRLPHGSPDAGHRAGGLPRAQGGSLGVVDVPQRPGRGSGREPRRTRARKSRRRSGGRWQEAPRRR